MYNHECRSVVCGLKMDVMTFDLCCSVVDGAGVFAVSLKRCSVRFDERRLSAFHLRRASAVADGVGDRMSVWCGALYC